jgi:hypothetical protein
VVDLVYSILQNGTCSQDDLPQRTEGLRHFVTVLVFQGMKVNSFSHFAQTHKPTQKYPLNLQKGLKKIASSEYRDWPPGAWRWPLNSNLFPRVRVAVLHFHHGVMLSPFGVKVTLTNHGQSASQIWCQAPFGVQDQIRVTVKTLAILSMWGRPLWREDGSVIYCCQSHIATDGQSVSQSVFVSSPIWGSWPDIYYCLTVTVLFLWSALSDERTGLSCCWLLLAQSFSSPSPLIRPYFTVSDLRLPVLSPPTTRRVTVEVFDPASYKHSAETPRKTYVLF